MSKSLRVLLVEDSDDDAQLLLRHLRKGEYQPEFVRVQTPEAMRSNLVSAEWDLVLADNSMPGFSAIAALDVLKESGCDLPFIIVSGHINDMDAVAAMKAGAHDYLLKDNLARLLPAIERELTEAEVRHARRMAESELRYHAYHDGLTGLLNRREFERSLEEALADARRHGHTHVLCYLDLDQFKLVNDTCGHVAGDEMLKQLGALLQTQVRGTDTLARLGGDEFGLLLERCPPDQAVQVLDKVREAVDDFRFVWDERTFDIGISIGMVQITADVQSITELLSAADVACYTAKEMGRNRTHMYEPGDKELARRRSEMQWVSRVTSAVDEDRLVLHKQPILDLAAGDQAPHRHEVLVRMVDEDGRITLPGAFIPAAERYKLMPTVDRWVLTTLFERYHDLLNQPGHITFVNISGGTISDDGFLPLVRGLLERHGVEPAALCFEITETAAIANLGKAVPVFQALKAVGCSFALDDFGSGLSSFTYLKNLPVDFIKIDGEFVRDMVDDAIDRAMVEAINKIGHVMGLRTIAESVEDQQTLESLRALGIDYAQGYWIGHPHPIAEAEPRDGAQ